MTVDRTDSRVRHFEVSAQHEASYRVCHEPGLLEHYGLALRDACGLATTIVLTDARVHALYAERCDRSLRAAGFDPRWVVVAEGERSKDLTTVRRVLDELLRLGMDRRGLLVNFGGGVISDLGGFVASAYMRGVRYANFATSMIGQVDASIGGKVAVNSAQAKNMIGAFHHPSHVAADAEMIATLGERDFRSGVAEAIKVGIIASPELFAMLAEQRKALRARQPAALTAVAELAARVKMDLVSRDPYERDLRRPLNFGHTLGHPIETDFAYQGVRHGEAVAIGMGVATLLARRQGRIGSRASGQIFDLLDRYGLIGCVGPLVPESVIEHLRCIRMVRGNALHFVLPVGIGAVHIVSELSDGDIVQAFEDYERLVQHRSAGLRWQELI